MTTEGVKRPLAIDLFCGLGGWSEGLLAEGWHCIGFDIEQHRYRKPKTMPDFGGTKLPAGNATSSKWSERAIPRFSDLGDKAEWSDEWMEYPATLVIQDVLTLHGSQFRDADLIVASPPCQAYSYRAMPWKRAKALPPPCNALFESCFRIQREACEAAGRHIPLIVENVRGAQKWVGRARWNYGSFYLWGDVPALMPPTLRAQKFNPDGTQHGQGSWFAIADSKNRGGRKAVQDGLGGYGGNFGSNNTPMRRSNSKSSARKAASAMIAKIPLPLSTWIARSFKSIELARAA